MVEPIIKYTKKCERERKKARKETRTEKMDRRIDRRERTERGARQV